MEFTQSTSSFVCVSGCNLDTNKSTLRTVLTDFTWLFDVEAPTTGFFVDFPDYSFREASGFDIRPDDLRLFATPANGFSLKFVAKGADVSVLR